MAVKPRGGAAPLAGGAARPPRMRGAASVVVFATLTLACYMLWMLGRPLYWKFYAEVIHRYDSDAAQQLIQELAKETGAAGTDNPTLDGLGGRKGWPGVKPGALSGGAFSQLPPGAIPTTTAAAAAAATAAAGGALQQPFATTTGAAAALPTAPAAQTQQQTTTQPQQQAPQEGASGGGGGGAAAAAVPIAVEAASPSPPPTAPPTPEELERQRKVAREKQWEDEWWKQYQKAEAARKARQEKEAREREKRLVKAFNHTLTREFVQSLAQDGYLVVTWANHHYTDFALSWVYHVQQVGIKGYIVGAMDDEILVALAKRKIHTFAMTSGLTTGDFGWGSKQFAKMGRKKINLIAKFLELGVNVIISDVDVMWLRNPIPFFARFPAADVLTSTDHLSTTVGADEALERYPEAGSAFNIGIMLFREKSLPFVREWIEVIEADDTIWDQNAFNDLIRAGQVIQDNDPNHYFLGANRSLTVGVLPVALFCSGHVFFTQKMHETLGVEPYAVHATFQFSGTPGKRHRFRDAGLWRDEDAYFRPFGGFLTFDGGIPKDLLERAGPRTDAMDIANTEGHFELVNYQLKKLRQALALATVLGRAVILPPLWCGLDRYWAPHAGTLPGSKFKLPFICPADHILDLEHGWAKAWDAEEYGPDISWRESSFLEHPSLPGAVKGSIVQVRSCREGESGCAGGDNPATLEFNKLSLKEGLDSDRIAMALSTVTSIAVLNFTTVDRAFGNFTRPEDYTRFFKRLQHYGSVWCCVDAHPGHVHYNFWWDTPHTDKFGRVWPGGKDGWRPMTGP